MFELSCDLWHNLYTLNEFYYDFHILKYFYDATYMMLSKINGCSGATFLPLIHTEVDNSIFTVT